MARRHEARKTEFHLRSHADDDMTWCGLDACTVKIARIFASKKRPTTPEAEICLTCRRERLLDQAEFRLLAYLIRNALWRSGGGML
jgi:hypothetical protein